MIGELASALLKGLSGLNHLLGFTLCTGYEGDVNATSPYGPIVSYLQMTFRSLIGLYNVNIHPLVEDGPSPYLGYEFGCSWDVEHGLGVLMHGLRVVEVGGAVYGDSIVDRKSGRWRREIKSAGQPRPLRAND